MTRAELLALVRQQSLISTTELGDTEIYALISQAYNDVAVLYTRWPWCFATTTINLVAATESYVLPTNLISLEGVSFVGQGRLPLAQTTREAVVRQFGETPGAASLPTMWYRQGLSIVFVPTPDDSTIDVKVTYFGTPASTTFDQTTESPAFDVAFHPLLSDYALAKIWEREEMEDKANFYWERYYGSVNRLAQFYNVQLPAIPFIVGSGYLRDRLLPWRNYLEA